MSQLINETLTVSNDNSNEVSEELNRRSNQRKRGINRLRNTNSRITPKRSRKNTSNITNRRNRINRNNNTTNSVIMGQIMVTNNSVPVREQELIQTNNELNSNPMTVNEPQNGGNNSVVNNDNNINNIENNNENSIEIGREVEILNETCIDLTQDESVVEENGVESDSEIQCISSYIRNPPNPELSIIRETNTRRRNRLTNRERVRDRSPIVRREQNDEGIEIISTQINPKISKDHSRKAIKCPICLDEEDAFESSGRQLVSTNCGHVFCNSCIKEVIKSTKVCPNCRKRVSTAKSYHPLYL